MEDHSNEVEVQGAEMKYLFKYVRASLLVVVTPHVRHERGKVIGCGVHIYICL